MEGSDLFAWLNPCRGYFFWVFLARLCSNSEETVSMWVLFILTAQIPVFPVFSSKRLSIFPKISTFESSCHFYFSKKCTFCGSLIMDISYTEIIFSSPIIITPCSRGRDCKCIIIFNNMGDDEFTGIYIFFQCYRL